MKFRFNSPGRSSGAGASGQAGFEKAAITGKGRALGFLFGVPFFAMGAFFCWIGAVKPILGVAQSASWPQVPCRIVSSEVKTNRDSDGDTYKIEITFAYNFEGREFTGGSYDFTDMSSSGYARKAEVTRRFPVGHETECWVNPSDPTVAVLSRNFPGVVFLILPFTSVFMLVGAAVMLGSLGLFPKKWQPSRLSRHQPVSQAGRPEMELKPSSGPVAKFFWSLFFAAFWNGIVGVFVWVAIDSFRKGDPEWFLVFFLIPFVAVGIGALGAVVYFALAFSNPRAHLTLNEGSPRLGDLVRLTWGLTGSVHRLQDLALTLEGREEATYQVGTRSTTDRSLFCREPIFQTEEPLSHRTGQISFAIPAGLMHSFSANSNKVKWTLHVRGAIPRWPDVNDSYPITVRPRETAR